jgi:hypothetical protein
VETYKMTVTCGPKKARGIEHQFGIQLGRHLVDVGIGPLLESKPSSAVYLTEPNRLVYKEFQEETIAG